jgi:hypothetical protein
VRREEEGGWIRGFDLDGEEERNWSSRLQLQPASPSVSQSITAVVRGVSE